MGDSDLWRQDGSFRGIQGKSGGGKGGGRGPEFTRVIPKFLQKYHEPPAIQTKFGPPPLPEGEEAGEGEDELDDVQKAAIAEFLEKDKIANVAGTDANDAGGDEESKSSSGATEEEKKKKRASQAVTSVGAGQQPMKKRKRKEMTALSNKKLLSFSMDDEE